MENKFGRDYLLQVETTEGTFVNVEMPFTLEFDIVRTDLGSANSANIRIYNLSIRNRDLIRKDVQGKNYTRKVVLNAGYGDNLPVVFTGFIQRAWSVREGNNFITTIVAEDAGLAFCLAPITYVAKAGTPLVDVITYLMGQMPNVSFGAIGSYPGVIARGHSYTGSIPDILNELTGGGLYIDNGHSFCLHNNEIAQQPQGPLVIQNSSGLLGTPLREETNVMVDILFEPQVFMGMQVHLISKSSESFNGLYKVYSIHHKGMISEAVCGDATTTLGLFNYAFISEAQ